MPRGGAGCGLRLLGNPAAGLGDGPEKGQVRGSQHNGALAAREGRRHGDVGGLSQSEHQRAHVERGRGSEALEGGGKALITWARCKIEPLARARWRKSWSMPAPLSAHCLKAVRRSGGAGTGAVADPLPQGGSKLGGVPPVELQDIAHGGRDRAQPCEPNLGQTHQRVPWREPSQRIMGRNAGKVSACSSKRAAVLLTHVRAGARQQLFVVRRRAQSLPKEGPRAGVSDREAGSWGTAIRIASTGCSRS